MATTTKDKKEEKKPEAETQDGPLLDLNSDSVKKMIRAAKKRGYVTVDELNSVLPSDEVSSEQIEDTMAMLSDMGINVVDEEETEDEVESTDLVESGEKAVAKTKKREPLSKILSSKRMRSFKSLTGLGNTIPFPGHRFAINSIGLKAPYRNFKDFFEISIKNIGCCSKTRLIAVSNKSCRIFSRHLKNVDILY